METRLQVIHDDIVNGKLDVVEADVRTALEAGLQPGDILERAMIPAMDEVGVLFEAGDYFVPEMLVAANAMKRGLTILRPLLISAGLQPFGRVVMCTVQGDLHDIGKNLVAMMLEGAGLEVHDLGTDISPALLVEKVREIKPDLVGLSALLTTTMPKMKLTIEAFEEANLRDQVGIMVGGAPVTEAFAVEIGADGYAPDASRAVVLAKQLIDRAASRHT
jgi:5-methyltetrahydrofolate--homocysteine methyltransferase